MLKMRLQRVGRKNDPAYRIVVTDSRRGPKSGKHVDLLGSHNPKLHVTQIDGDKAKDWIAKGVQVSDTVHNILVTQKVIDAKKINVLPKKSPIISEKAAEEAKEETKIPAEEKGEETEVVEEKVEVEEVAEEVKEEKPEEEVKADTAEEEKKG